MTLQVTPDQVNGPAIQITIKPLVSTCSISIKKKSKIKWLYHYTISEFLFLIRNKNSKTMKLFIRVLYEILDKKKQIPSVPVNWLQEELVFESICNFLWMYLYL